MPAIEFLMRCQSAAYWPLVGSNPAGEFVVSGTPQDLNPRAKAGGVRWELGRKQSVDSKGNTIAFDGYLHVPFAVVVGDCVWKPPVDSKPAVPQLPNPISKITGVMRVIDYAEAPDLKNRNVLRIAKLMRVSNVLPTS